MAVKHLPPSPRDIASGVRRVHAAELLRENPVLTARGLADWLLHASGVARLREIDAPHPDFPGVRPVVRGVTKFRDHLLSDGSYDPAHFVYRLTYDPAQIAKARGKRGES